MSWKENILRLFLWNINPCFSVLLSIIESSCLKYVYNDKVHITIEHIYLFRIFLSFKVSLVKIVCFYKCIWCTKLMVLGNINGAFGRLPTRWSNLIRYLTGAPVQDSYRSAQDCSRWKVIVFRQIVTISDHCPQTWGMRCGWKRILKQGK